ncbi:MAG: Hsp20/alpha crystallin family protein [Planctomycetota bacterium]|nr:Hsp20/alpha crystallin family protein [Planctomycetota bacterium]
MLARMYRPLPAGFGPEVSSLFDEFFRGAPLGGLAGEGNGASIPALNIWEQDQTYVVEAELPGLKLEEIEISVAGNELSLKGERKAEAKEGLTYHRRERGAGAFSRVVRFPVDLDAERAEARLENGVLTLSLPKHQASQPRRIQIRAANPE